MGRVSVAVLIAAWALLGQAFAQAPERIYGTADGEITLFTPAEVVTAGGGGATGTPLSDATPLVESGTGSPGIATSASRGDHAHPARAIRQLPANPSGTVSHYLRATSSGASWQQGEIVPHFTPDDKNDCLRINGLGTGMTWIACPGSGGNATPLSDQTPQNVGATGAAGSASSASREDHVHGRGAVPREVPAPSNAVTLDIPRVNSAGNAYELIDAHVAVLAGLPSVTGHGGNCLKVNSAATGYELGACGSGGGGSGGGTADIARFINGRANEISELPYTQLFGGLSFSQDSQVLIQAFAQLTAGGEAVTNTNVIIWTDVSGTRKVCAPRTSFEKLGGKGTTFGFGQALCTIAANTATNIGLSTSVGGSFSTGKLNWLYSAMLLPTTISAGGGGGSSGPSIPAPTAAGADKYLRVNAAGAAYELGAALDADIGEVEEGVAALQRVTQDLSVASVATPWATSAVQGAGIATGTCSTSAAPSSGYAATKARPQAGWPANTCIFAQLPKGADRTTYRVVEPQGDSATFFDPGGSWRLKLASPSSATRDYYLVNTVSPGDASLTLQHGGAIQRTTFRGRVAAWGGDLPAIPGDTATKDYALQTKADGSGVVWSNEAFSSLMVNAQDIGEALERVGHIDKPGDAEADKSTLGAGQVWEIKSCTDSGGSRTCTAGFSAERHTQHHLVTHGTGAPNATSQSFPGTGRLTQHALISGTSYDEFLIVVRHVSGNPVRTHIRSCRIPGIQGDWLANAAHAVVLTGEGGACTLTAPTTGNLTLTWVTPLSGNKILGDMWRLYGVDWQ